jgi:hypothetical protein
MRESVSFLAVLVHIPVPVNVPWSVTPSEGDRKSI